jgi:putative transposase
MDSMSDSTTDGHRFRILTLIDTFTRRAPGAIVERSIGGPRLVRFLDELPSPTATREPSRSTTARNSSPRRSTNGLTPTAVQLIFSRPGKPVDNAFIESFNGRVRDECLNTHWFYGLEQARQVIHEWLEDYNNRRPHSSLAGLTPAEYETQHRTPSVD